MMYKEKKVYYANGEVFTNRGMCCDSLNHSDEMEEGRVLYAPEHILTNGQSLYRYSLSNGSYSSWFVTPEDAKHANSGIGVEVEQLFRATLVTDEVSPLPERFTVSFTKSEDGRFSALVNRNPELNGMKTFLRKVFFPSRKWDGPIGVGEAIVSIDSEKPTYGFLVGEMVKADMPEDLKDFAYELCCQDQKEFPRQRVLEVNSPIHGHYMAVETVFPAWRGNTPKTYEQAVLNSNAVEEDLSLGYEVAHYTMYEFVGKYLFGVNSSKEIFQRLRDVDNWFHKNHRRVNEPFVRDESSFFDLVYEANLMGNTDEEYMSNMDLLGDAFDRWVLLPVTVADVPLIEVHLDEYQSNDLFQFCPEDLDNLIALTKKINEHGYAELKSLLQRRALVFVS